MVCIAWEYLPISKELVSDIEYFKASQSEKLCKKAVEFHTSLKRNQSLILNCGDRYQYRVILNLSLTDSIEFLKNQYLV